MLPLSHEHTVALSIEVNLLFLLDYVSVRNKSLVPVQISVYVSPDFYIHSNGTNLRFFHTEIGPGSEFSTGIVFLPEILDKRYDMRKGSLTIDLDHHPKVVR